MNRSDKIADLAAALSKVQATIEGARKASVNPHFKNKYADLASVWDACREQLTANGLSVVQSPGLTIDGKMEMTTMLLHSSGQWIEGTMSIPIGKQDAQGYGSATTYARRYALAAMVGVSPEDDDGNAASGPTRATNEATINADQCIELRKLVAQSGATEEAFCDYLSRGGARINLLPELPASRFTAAKASLEDRISRISRAAPQRDAA